MSGERSGCQICRTPVSEEYCNACWYPGIDEDYQEFIALLDEGHARHAAYVLSGLKGAEEV
ncbi:MAG: hypothetical protein AB9Q19_01455 [Candidatus Reddybacter sp.]